MSLPIKDGNGTLTSVKTTLDGSDHVPHHLVDNFPSGGATEATLAALLAKILASPSTEAKQDTVISALASILSKIIAAPSTEAKQDTLLSAILPTLSNFRNLTLSSTAVAVKASSGELWGFNIINLQSSDLYIKFYNIAAASVNPASDVPVLTLLLPGSATIFMEPQCRLHAFSTAISVRAVGGSGDTSTTVPTTSPIIELKYI